MTPALKRCIARALTAGLLAATSSAMADYFPIYSTWNQPGGPGSAVGLTYSYSNLLDGSLVNRMTGQSFHGELLRNAFETALRDYSAILPISFLEIQDLGPLPETGQYDPAGLADIRVGVVPSVAKANAYAYFPNDNGADGLAGDIVFNAMAPWTPSFFYGVAQHELGHALGMGHAVPENAASFQEANQAAGYDGPIFPLAPDAIGALQAAYGIGSGMVVPLSPVPEPSVMAMWGCGLMMLGFGMRRRVSLA
jgi:hypothetical protein